MRFELKLNSIFFSYERLCESPLPLLTTLVTRLGVEHDMKDAAAGYEAAEKRECDGVSADLENRCNEIYERLSLRGVG